MRSGWAIAKGGPQIRVGPIDLALGAAAVDGDIATPESFGEIYLGGSGRNLRISGFPNAIYDGVWQHGYPGKWLFSKLSLWQVASGAATISDGLSVVAARPSGGTPGTLTSTPYGESLLGSAPFTLAVAAEWAAPGVIPRVSLQTSASGMMAMDFTPTDAANYVSDQDPLFTIHIDEDGTARYRFDGAEIATREDGPNDNPAGEYLSTLAGKYWNPATPPVDETDPPETNNFGVLTLVYSWPATPDLDTTTEFLGRAVGYPGPYLVPYMTHSGDNTSPSGSETVVIDLATAWNDGAISDVADITCKADWYPAASSGMATLSVSYTAGVFPPSSLIIRPGNIRPGSKTVVARLHIKHDGTITRYYEPWTATVTRKRVPPPAGVVYLTEVQTAGLLTSIAGPVFQPTRPPDTANEFHIPLATSDGLGVLETIWTGPLLRR